MKRSVVKETSAGELQQEKGEGKKERKVQKRDICY